jgi:hypothetical protein
MLYRHRLVLTGALCFILGAMLMGPTHVGVAQDKTPPPKGDKGAGYRLLLAGSGKGWQALRYKQTTGETWLVDKLSWVPVNEADKVPAGDYEVQLVLMEGSWSSIRIDRATGRSWHFNEGKWNPIAERK